MPLKIIRQDITKIECDAIVNPSNSNLWPGGGVDAAIHEAAGPELFELCQTLGGCKVGEAKITPGFRLPAKYVIHTVGPEWNGGTSDEQELLRSSYKQSMELAIQHGCESVAFPLISSGLHGFPKDRVLRIAVDTIGEYLLDNEIDVFVLVYDKTAYSISQELFHDVTSYVDNFYVEMHFDMFDGFREEKNNSQLIKKKRNYLQRIEDAKSSHSPMGYAASCSMQRLPRDLDGMLKSMDKSFAETLFYYIDKKGISDVECYKRSNVGKKTFSKIKCNNSYRPSKLTAVSFAIGLHLSMKETAHLLSTAGMCLSRSDKFDVIIEYFITTGKYETIFDVNEVLYQFDQPLLGV